MPVVGTAVAAVAAVVAAVDYSTLHSNLQCLRREAIASAVGTGAAAVVVGGAAVVVAALFCVKPLIKLLLLSIPIGLLSCSSRFLSCSIQDALFLFVKLHSLQLDRFHVQDDFEHNAICGI